MTTDCRNHLQVEFPKLREGSLLSEIYNKFIMQFCTLPPSPLFKNSNKMFICTLSVLARVSASLCTYLHLRVPTEVRAGVRFPRPEVTGSVGVTWYPPSIPPAFFPLLWESLSSSFTYGLWLPLLGEIFNAEDTVRAFHKRFVYPSSL